jgi:hypothetical protein
MKTMLLATVVALGLAAAPVFAADSPAKISSDVVGSWIYDGSGQIVGSLCGLTDHGRKATVMVGSYFLPGSHLMTIPANLLQMANGRVTVLPDAAVALLSVPPAGFAG